MDNKPTAREYIKKGILLVVLVAAAFYFLLRGQNLKLVFTAMAGADYRFIALGALCMCVYLCCEALNLRRAVHMMGHRDVTFVKSTRYAFSGFFGSAITPFASGGQPLQAYYMYQDGVPLAHSTLALLVQLACYHTVSVVASLVAFLTQRELLTEALGGSRFWLLAGVGINALLLVFYLFAIFSKKLTPAAAHGVLRLLAKLGVKNTDAMRDKVDAQLSAYASSAEIFKTQKKQVLLLLLTALLQITMLHSIPYWVYRAYGLSGYSFLTVVSMQLLLYVTVAVLPLPGAVGASEGGFLLLFSLLFPKELLSPAMLLSRGLSFYLFVFVSAAALGGNYLVRTAKLAHSAKKA